MSKVKYVLSENTINDKYFDPFFHWVYKVVPKQKAIDDLKKRLVKEDNENLGQHILQALKDLLECDDFYVIEGFYISYYHSKSEDFERQCENLLACHASHVENYEEVRDVVERFWGLEGDKYTYIDRLIHYCIEKGHGYEKFALNVREQGFCTEKQKKTMEKMIKEYLVKNKYARERRESKNSFSPRKDYYPFDSDISEMQLMDSAYGAFDSNF